MPTIDELIETAQQIYGQPTDQKPVLPHEPQPVPVQKIMPIVEADGLIESMDKKARQAGFLALRSGEVYERQTADNSHVFVIRNDFGKWDAWRETWSRNKDSARTTQSVSVKDIRYNTTFDVALDKAKQYVLSLSKFKR